VLRTLEGREDSLGHCDNKRAFLTSRCEADATEPDEAVAWGAGIRCRSANRIRRARFCCTSVKLLELEAESCVIRGDAEREVQGSRGGHAYAGATCGSSGPERQTGELGCGGLISAPQELLPARVIWRCGSGCCLDAGRASRVGWLVASLARRGLKTHL